MFVTYDWIKRYIDIDLSPEELAAKLTMAGLETNLAEAADKTDGGGGVLEVDITPNRADCLSVRGMAREIAANTTLSIKEQEFSIVEGEEDISSQIFVVVENSERCPHYAVRLIKGVNIAPSPEWLSKLLSATGTRPINNVVDVTNFILQDEGQPLHAFDYHLISGKRIIVRGAVPKEKFTTLDEKERELAEQDLLIADESKGIALAGIMGGLNTEVKDNTKDILLECAYFEPIGVRKTSRRLGVYSESATRFGRGVDPDGVIRTLDRAAALIQELAGGIICKGIVQVAAPKKPERVVELRIERVNKFLGTSLDMETVTAILDGLTFLYEKKENSLSVKIPSYRGDIEREVDLIEEIARLYGYNRIPATIPKFTISPAKIPKRLTLERDIRGLLSGLGLCEAINYSFIRKDDAFPFGIDAGEPIALSNPISSEMSIMRQSIIPGLLRNISTNQKRGNSCVSLYEMGKVFLNHSQGRVEKTLLTIAMTPSPIKSLWRKEKRSFYDLKGLAEQIMNVTGTAAPTLTEGDTGAMFHPGKSAVVTVDGTRVGVVGVQHPSYKAHFEVNEEALLLEIDLDLLITLKNNAHKYTALSKYPFVTRDISLTVDKQVTADDIAGMIRETGGEILKNVTLFDLYEGSSIPEGKKSLAFSLLFGSDTRTLTDDEMNVAYDTILNQVNEKIGGTLR